jgi:microcystin degradation protein MlrC
MPEVKRVFIGSIATETNTFSPLRTDLQDFKDSFYAPPGQHPATPTLCSAIYPVARARAQALNWQVIEGTAAWAEPGGVINQHTWVFLRDQLLSELRAAMPVDIVLLGLHGAMVAQECNDCDGELLHNVRAIVGPNVVIGATFDPHSHLTQARVNNATVLTVFKEFPHTDFVETAENLITLAHRTSLKQITPKISTFDCKMIEIFPTSRNPMRSFVDRIKALEGQNNILSISVIHGFMAGDVAELGTRTIVITDNAQSTGDALAAKLGMELFAMRGATRPDFQTPSAAFDAALRVTKGPVVIADVWDNPGGGVPGDSTIILREMMRRNLSNVALASIWDPIAVRTCFSAGQGAELGLRFGGKMSAQGGEPIDAIVKVIKTIRNATQSFGQSIVPLGDAVWIKIDGIDLILNSVRSQVFNPDIFSNFGIDPAQKAILVVKSTNHFQDAFSRLTPEILYAAVNGPYPNDPKTTAYRNLIRPIWPLIENPHET